MTDQMKDLMFNVLLAVGAAAAFTFILIYQPSPGSVAARYSHAAADPQVQQVPQIDVSVVKLTTEFVLGKEYRTVFLVQVEAKSALSGRLTLSCVGFNEAGQPVAETGVTLYNVPANEPTFQQEVNYWSDRATSVKCRTVEY